MKAMQEFITFGNWWLTFNAYNAMKTKFSKRMMVSVLNGISTFVGYLMPKQPWEEQQWVDKGVHIFPKLICPKVNVIAGLPPPW